MSGIISGNMVGGAAPLRTLIIEDADGNEFTGVVTGSEVIFDATPADVKIGKVFAGDEGVLEGTDTKTYRTIHADCLILPGENFSITLEHNDQYDYTKFQAMISEFNTTKFDSTAINKISIHDSVYNVNSNDKLSDVSKNQETKSIDLNITNDTNSVYIINFNTYKEE